MFGIPDESVKEQCGVADDACGAGLLVLTALQGQPIIHVTFSVQTRLERTGGEGARHIVHETTQGQLKRKEQK